MKEYIVCYWENENNNIQFTIINIISMAYCKTVVTPVH